MPKSRMTSEVDKYPGGRWHEETEKLRTILLELGLDEELKWGKPCYSFQNKNIVLIQGFKEYFALLFFKGYLLRDPNGILVKTGANTRVGRQIRFANVQEIVKLKPILKTYICEAIEVEKAGLKGNFKKKAEPIPRELQNKFDKTPSFKTAFKALTPGRQRAYILYFSAAKQSKTRESRIEKYTKQILAGKGLVDR